MFTIMSAMPAETFIQKLTSFNRLYEHVRFSATNEHTCALIIRLMSSIKAKETNETCPAKTHLLKIFVTVQDFCHCLLSYTGKGRTLIQELPAPNAYTKTFSCLLMHAYVHLCCIWDQNCGTSLYS